MCPQSLLIVTAARDTIEPGCPFGPQTPTIILPPQPLAHAQFVSNVVDYGMNIQAALEAARFTVSPRLGCHIVIESRVDPGVLQTLSKMGHHLEVHREYSSAMGRGQPVLHDSNAKVNYGASDARADGSAEPEPPPVAW
jgi:gamma-glutamyltranspeptidase/glutathione hydrolase